MIPEELHKKIKSLEIKASHLVTDVLAGEYQSSFKGRGMEFDEVREYQPGDDIRSIDWNVTARTSTPHVKVFKEEREMTMVVMVDVSASLFYGSIPRSKLEVAAEIAAIFAYLAIRNNDKVGLLLFSDHVELFIPPRKGRGHIWRIIQTVLSHKAHGGRTELGESLSYFLKMNYRRSLCVLISDFYFQDDVKSLTQLALKHDLIGIQLNDRREINVHRSGLIRFRDGETGEKKVINTSSRKNERDLAIESEERRSKVLDLSRRLGFDLLQITSDEEVIDALQKLFRQRSLRKRRR